MKKSIAQVDVAGQNVLTRVDFNVPVSGGAVQDDHRIRAAVPTIRSIIDRGGRAILMSHLGRPKDGFDPSLSLKPVAEALSGILGVDVAFPSADRCDEPMDKIVGEMSDGGVMLLENLRFHAGERDGSDEFASHLAPLGDVYCNDAFGTCHRKDASMVGVPQAMGGKPRVAGLLVLDELTKFNEILGAPESPFVAVLGGAKVSDKLPVIERLIPKTEAICVGGAMAYTFLAALGKKVGKSPVETGMIADAKRIMELAAKESCDLHLPSDHIASTEFSRTAGDIETFEESIGDGYMGLDIGPETQGKYAAVVSKAKTVAWNGPMGVFEWPPFAVGTAMVAQAAAEATEAGGKSYVGGGDSASAAEKAGVTSRLTHVSTGGGASLALLSGETMAAIDLLDGA